MNILTNLVTLKEIISKLGAIEKTSIDNYIIFIDKMQ